MSVSLAPEAGRTSITLEPVADRRALRQFIRLAHELHRDHAGWVPQLDMDERRMFDPRRNLALRYSESALWLAREGGRVVGRIGAIVNHRYNEVKHEREAR
ncbi:MAG TPA: hypothetical protein VF832_21090, partial [Longimicrobiales bacterium]